MQCMLRVLLILMGFICFIIFLHIHHFHSYVSSFSHCSLFSSLAIIFSVLIMFIMFHNCSSFFTVFASESHSRVRRPSPPPKKSAPPKQKGAKHKSTRLLPLKPSLIPNFVLPGLGRLYTEHQGLEEKYVGKRPADDL